eukprot:scaffold16702_cov20-Tisochrysis_lutea.AAC.3
MEAILSCTMHMPCADQHKPVPLQCLQESRREERACSALHLSQHHDGMQLEGFQGQFFQSRLPRTD